MKKHNMKKHLLGTCAIAVLGLGVFGAGSASATTLHVATTGTDSGTCGPTATPCGSVGQAVTNAAAADTIRVGAGTFTGSAQVLINKSLTLRGAGTGATTLKPGFNTGSSGDARGWFLVNSSSVFRVNNLTLDGNSPTNQVYQAIRVTSGTLTANSVHFTNIKGTQYVGAGIGALTGTSVSVSNSTFTNIERIGINSFGTGDFVGNTYVGKGPGDHLDYALDIGGGGDWDVSGNTVSGNTGVAVSDGSTSAGFLVSTFFGPGTAASFTGNNIINNTTGIAVGFDEFDTSTVDASYNRIVGNGDGIVTTDPGVDAENNWWGCNAGPTAAACDSVAGSVDADPWLVLGGNASPNKVYAVNGQSQVTASLTRNSAGLVAGGAGFPNNVPVAFAADVLGSVSPTSDLTDGGKAQTLFSAGPTTGTSNVTVTLDGQAVAVPITIVQAPQGSPGATGATGAQGATGAAGAVSGVTKKSCKKGKKLNKKGKCVKKKKK